MAEQFLSSFESKLEEGETAVWGEIPRLIRGPVEFREFSCNASPCPVIDVYLVLGGVFGSEAHYRIQSSPTESGFDYIHRLSFYHLNPFTFRRVMEDAVMSILSALKNQEKIIASTKADSIISVTSTNDALELTCRLNGARTPSWMLRFVTAIQGTGAPPPMPQQTDRTPQWLVVPPSRVRRDFETTWEVTCLPEEEVTQDEVDDVTDRIGRTVNDENGGERVELIEESIDRRKNEESSVDGRQDGEVMLRELARDLTGFEPSEVMSKKMANGATCGIPNGSCNGVKKSDKRGENDAERAKKRYFGIFAICLVLVVVGLVFVVAWFEDADVIKLMHAGKFVLSNDKEF